MIKFFRRIRQRLLSENNFSKYLIYAIGEIILVVIGILIAVQVNNWNESQKSMRQQNALIENITSEFQTNILNLEETKKQNTLLYNSTLQLKKLIGKGHSELSQYNIDSLLYTAIIIKDFQPNQFATTQLKTGSNIGTIRSEKIKSLLYEWDRALNNKTESFVMLNTYFMNSLIPFLDDNTSIRNMDIYGNHSWSDKTPLAYDSSKIFNMIKFDNRLENHIWCVNSFNNAIESLITIAQKIIEEIENDKQDA